MSVDENLVGSFCGPEYVALPCNQRLTHIVTNRLDMVLSDEHRILYHTEKNKCKLEEITLENAVSLHEAQATGFRGLIPCVLHGVEPIRSAELDEISVRVHVMVSADGWVRNQVTKRCSVRVKKERKKIRARELLTQYTND